MASAPTIINHVLHFHTAAAPQVGPDAHVRHIHFADPQDPDLAVQVAGKLNLPVQIASVMYLDGVQHEWWGASPYNLGTWQLGGQWHPSNAEREALGEWTVTGGRAQETRVRFNVPADALMVDPLRREAFLHGRKILVPPLSDVPIDLRLRAALRIHPKAPVEIEVMVARFTTGAPL